MEGVGWFNRCADVFAGKIIGKAQGIWALHAGAE